MPWSGGLLRDKLKYGIDWQSFGFVSKHFNFCGAHYASFHFHESRVLGTLKGRSLRLVIHSYFIHFHIFSCFQLGAVALSSRCLEAQWVRLRWRVPKCTKHHLRTCRKSELPGSYLVYLSLHAVSWLQAFSCKEDLAKVQFNVTDRHGNSGLPKVAKVEVPTVLPMFNTLTQLKLQRSQGQDGHGGAGGLEATSLLRTMFRYMAPLSLCYAVVPGTKPLKALQTRWTVGMWMLDVLGTRELITL